MSEDKKILFVGNNISNPEGGERSLLQISELAEEEFDYNSKVVFFDTESVEDERFEVIDILPSRLMEILPYEARMFIRFLWPRMKPEDFQEKLDEFQPDLIVSQTQSTYISALEAQKRDIPLVTLIRATEFLYKDYFHGKNILTKTANAVPARINQAFVNTVFSESGKVVANSKYTSGIYTEQYEELESKMDVMYPYVEESEYKVSETGDKILHVNPIEPKGIQKTLEIAEEMPDQEFLVVGHEGKEKIMQRIEKLPNVEYDGFYEDMKEVYRQTKVVLVPSQWNEPFGRMSIEAAYSGIPVITSGKGGLSESMQVEELNVYSGKTEDYISAINKVLDNYDFFAGLVSENASKRKREALQSLEEILES